jgi:hypothetical protein
MARPPVARRALTILPIVIAILFMLLISLMGIAIVARAITAGAEASRREAEQHQAKMRQWIKTYIYNVSLCKLLNLTVRGLKGEQIAQQDLNVSGPVKILVANEGGGKVRLEHMIVQALGTIVHEEGLNIELPPGGWIVYRPRDLGLPDDYKALMSSLDIIAFFGGGETYNTTYFQPPPITYVEVGADGRCVEP